MKKHKNARRRGAKAAAVILTAAMTFQAVAPAMASPQFGELSSGRTVRTASQSNADRGNSHKATSSNAASNAEKATLSNALKKELGNIHPNGSFETTAKTTNEAYKKVWVDEIMPTGWTMWPNPKGNEKMTFEIVNDPTEAPEGNNYLRIRSENTSSRLGISYAMKPIADPAINYQCTFMVKAENVTGTGFNARLTWLKATQSSDYNETAQIKGTTDGWIQYEFTSLNPPEDAVGIQVEFYATNMAGEICLDDIQLVPTYRIALNKTDTSMLTGDTLELEAKCNGAYDGEITWSSSDPAIADVDENGIVTAYAMGMVEITAQIDEQHKAVCRISVEDGELRPYYEAIRENWRNRLTGNNIADDSDEVYAAMMKDLTDTAQKYWETMEKGGLERTRLWNDIDFTYSKVDSVANITEGLGTGFSRIEQMATAYSSKGSELYQNEELKKDIIGALEWAYAKIYNDSMDVKKDLYGNWWHWFIGMPQSLCNTVILMYDEMDPELIEREAKTLENFNEDPRYRYHTSTGNKIDNTAANLIDTSLVSALRASIGETAKPLNMAKALLGNSIGFVTEGNGYYEDGSYIDHGNLAYTGGYGSTLLGGIEKFLFIIADSPWDVSSDQLTSVYQWIWNGIRPLYVDGAVMDMTTGRGVARPSTNEHTVGRGLLKPIVHLINRAPDEYREEICAFAKTEIQAGLDYNKDYFIGMTVTDMMAMNNLLADDSLEEDAQVYHKNFGVMDKAVYHGENFDLGISMYSKRTGNFEYGNKENLKGWHMSDGALFLYNGDQSQYADVYWPTVDAHRLAGITTDHTEGFIPSDESWGPHTSKKDWVGGSSVLSQYGTVGMDFEGETKSGGISSLKAKKSWFTFPDAVVALGAGINSNEGKATETIVDNRKVRDDAANTVWVNGQEASLTTGEAAVMPVNWALLEGNEGESQNIGYYFPEETEISVLKETRIGNWRDINGAVGAGSANDREIIRSYISLAVDHGINPQDETYSYVLLPGRNTDEMAEFAENPDVKILANTAEVQAVQNTKYGVSGYNFWTACDVEGLEVSAKTPASVTIARDGNTITAGISNPTQNGQDTIVVLNGYYEPVDTEDGVTVTNQGSRTLLTIEGTVDFGKTYTVVLAGLEEKLDKWQNQVENAIRDGKIDVETILKEIEALDTAQLNEAQKEQIAAILKAASEKLATIETVNEVMAPISQVDEVTFDNADAVEAYLKKCEALTDSDKAVLSQADYAKIAALSAGFQKEEIHMATDGVTARAVNGTMDVRTVLFLNDESASSELYQAALSETETFLSLYRPALFLKDKGLSLKENPIAITMKAPAAVSGEEGTLKLYCFAPAGRTRAAVTAEEVPFIKNNDGTVTFEARRDAVYGFALLKEVKPEPTPEPEPEPTPNTKPSRGGGSSHGSISDGTWVLDNNGWWFRHYNGTWPSSQWKWVKGYWYHFNEAGYMQTGWILDKGLWYYLKPDGSMASNEWVLYKDRWYFLSRNGEMLANTSITWKNIMYQLGADGAMVE